MIVIDLIINGQHVVTAGAEDLSVLGGHLSAVGKLGKTSQGAQARREGVEITCDLGGMTSRSVEPKNVHFTWNHTELKVGDEICLRIREATTADPPRNT
jgi:hypothetical protein